MGIAADRMRLPTDAEPTSSDDAAPDTRVDGERWKPRWLHDGACVLNDELALRSWEQFAWAQPDASAYFSPCVALLSRQNRGVPLVYARWLPTADSPRLNSLAVLPFENRKFDIVAPLGWHMTIAGRRVLENCLLGDRSPDSINCFTNSMATLVVSGETDFILFQDLDVTCPLREALATVARQHRLAVYYPWSPVSRWWIRFPDKPEEYWSQFSKKTRYNFRYRAKHLEHTVRCVTSAQEIPAFIDAVKTVEQKTWQYRRLGLASDAQQKLELWSQWATMGAFRSYLMEQQGRPVAFAIGVQWKDRYTYVETGYDPEYATKSPGQVLLYRMLEDLIARNPPKLLDFGFGDSEYKRMFANHETQSGPVVLVRRSVRAMMAWRLMQWRSTIGRGGRRVLSKVGVLSLLRHLHRGTLAAGISDALSWGS